MDLRQLADHLGGTVFADDYRTNLAAARERIASLEASLISNSQDGGNSALLLLQAVFSSIRGDFAAADSYLTHLYSLANSHNDSGLLSRCALYEMYFRCTKNIPPFLRFRVDSDTGPAVVRGIGISALRGQFLRRRIERGTQELSPLEKFEANILRTCTSFLNDLWIEALPEHPQYFKDHSIVLFTEQRNYWEKVRQLGIDTDSPTFARYLDKLTVQYRLTGNASNARSSLFGIYESAFEGGDFITAANCQLQLGDAILSPPFTSPFALNLVSVVREVGWSNDFWDKKEREFPLVRDPEAMQCYQQADFLFGAGGSQRGRAAILLRYACLDLADAILTHREKDAEAEKDSLNSAFDHLTDARGLFEGDITNTLIVNGHLVICNIMRKDHSKALELCFDIGDTGKQTQNTCTTEFVGTLFLRLARRLALDDKGVQHAVVCCACARVCFKALNNPYLELHAVAASAKLQQTQGNIPIASKHVDYGRNLLDRADAFFDKLKSEVQNWRSSYEDQEQQWLDHDLEMLRGKRTACIIDFGRLASAIEGSNQNRNAKAAEQSSRLLGTSPIMAMLQSMLVSGIDPSLMEMFQPLMPTVNRIDSLRQKYETAIRLRRDELVINADIDAGEQHLVDILAQLSEFSETNLSDEVESMKTVALQHLGDFDRARSTITRVLPTSFGGTKASLPEPAGANWQIKNMMADEERQQLDRAVSLCFAAKDWKRGMTGLQYMLQKDPTSLDDMRTSKDPDIWYNMVWTACIMEKNGDIGRAFEWYLSAYEVVEANRQRLADAKDRRDIFSTIHSGELFLGMARVAFQFAETPDGGTRGRSQQWKLTPSEWKNQGLRFLELGRSRTLLDILIAEKLAPQDLKAWSEYSYQLRVEETLSSKEHTTATKPQDGTDDEPESRQQYLEWVHGELVAELNPQSLSRLLPDTESVRAFNEKLYQCVPENALILHINVGREGLMILCITSQGIIDIHATETTDLEMNRHVFRFAKLLRKLRTSDPSSLPPTATCDQHLQAVSDLIIKPVAQHIQTKEHIIFIPSPSLNKFPLSALIYDKKPLFLSKDVSQVPSLSVLQYLADKQHAAKKKISVIYKDRNHGEPLDISTSAAISIARSFSVDPQMANENLSQDDFVKMYEQSDVVLIATHGTQDTKSAWESSLLLTPPFRVLDLARLHSNASLIIFEACVSGLGEESIGNDLLGFSHAVLASGASAFLGGLWKVSDEASALLMLFLFEEIKSAQESTSLARCWRNAQTHLYHLDATRVQALLEELSRDCLAAFKAKQIDKDPARELRKTLRTAVEDLRLGADFKHPFYWAPFVVMGHAGRGLG